MKELRAVIDSNIIVNILKGSQRLSFIYSAFKEERFKLVVSAEVLRELSAVLYRPRLKIDPNDVKELFRVIKVTALRIKLPRPFIDVCRDVKDNFLLELAVESGAGFIVTRDKDLLCLNPFRGIPIITPNNFIKTLKGL